MKRKQKEMLKQTIDVTMAICDKTLKLKLLPFSHCKYILTNCKFYGFLP